MQRIQNYVWCVECVCTVQFWDSYRWHSDQNHTLQWGPMARAAYRHRVPE